jgi:hypothetical protein
VTRSALAWAATPWGAVTGAAAGLADGDADASPAPLFATATTVPIVAITATLTRIAMIVVLELGPGGADAPGGAIVCVGWSGGGGIDVIGAVVSRRVQGNIGPMSRPRRSPRARRSVA